MNANAILCRECSSEIQVKNENISALEDIISGHHHEIIDLRGKNHEREEVDNAIRSSASTNDTAKL